MPINKELQKKLLLGDTFQYVHSIELDGLNDLYNVLLSGKVTGDVYGRGIKIKQRKAMTSEKAKLEEVNEQIGLVSSEDWQQSVSDEELLIL